ncbi:signal peptidase I [Aestuariibaculum sp. M13]|uniref:signal peptidase I n=1 Tax=Aestuariibaculum sp. M13 TaxID=2967132 RepID=UPI002159D079|nr:signal peptidase I [Aestuariibaculum sp. M13]MCR8667462.1 signal peptidase I [Aestuariibaculum sp. M13]
MKTNKYYLIFFIILLTILLFTCFFSILKVHSSSMSNTINEGDYALLCKTRQIEKKDIVVFNLLDNKYLKRCVAMPGDTITINVNGVKVNSDFVNESYINKTKGIIPFLANKTYFMQDYIVPFKGFTSIITPLFYKKYAHLINELENSEFNVIGEKYFLGGKEIKAYTFQEDCFYLLGDNRDVSKDSRYFGAIPENKIFGKLIFN